MVLIQIWPFFQLLFQPIQARKMSFTICQNETTPFYALKEKVEKVKILKFFQRGQPMVLVQKWQFFQLFLGNIGQKNVFYDILIKKMPFQATKTKRSKSRKNDIFLNGLTQGFGPKMAIFPTFLLGNIGQKNVFYDILERKNAFLGYIKKV